MASHKAITFRIKHVPPNFTLERLTAVFQQLSNTDEPADLQLSGSLLPSCYASDRSQTAIVQFIPGPPKCLEGVLNDKTGVTEWQIKIDSSIVSVDKNFFGLTQLFKPRNELDVPMDVVAITGLDGNAFGSWKSRESGVMWLRDFLNEDLSNCRVMTYGYNTKLSSNRSHRFEDFCTQFLEEIQLSRTSQQELYRPLILIGHSYGSRIITRSLVKCKICDNDVKFGALLAATQTVVFFGAPHRGMNTDDIEQYLHSEYPDSKPRVDIVSELKPDNEGVIRELQDFVDLIGSFFVISIYERKPSRKLVAKEGSNLGDSTGPCLRPIQRVWDRIGQEYVPVDVNSALLSLPSWLEIRIPSESDHSNMAKFDHKDSTYQVLLSYLRKVEASANSSAFPWLDLLRPGTRLMTSQDDGHGRYYDRWRDSEPLDNPMKGYWTILDVAISLCVSLQSESGMSPADILLFQQIELTLREAQNYISFAQGTAQDVSPGGVGSNLREMRSTMMDYRKALNDLIKVLDSFKRNMGEESQTSSETRALVREKSGLSPQARSELDESNRRLCQLNQATGRILGSETYRLYRSSKIPASPEDRSQDKMGTLAKMYVARNRTNNPATTGPIWVPFESLYFQVGAPSEEHREDKSWLQKIVDAFTKSDARNFKMQPRRYGVLSRENQLEKVMVEFRPYPSNLRQLDPSEYDRRHWQISRLADMLLSAVSDDSAAPFPCVPLRCLSDMSDSSTPCFLLIYAASGLYGLDELIEKHETPSVAERVDLALSFAKSLASLHLAGLVHGNINTENLYVRLPVDANKPQAVPVPKDLDISRATPLLAGFEIARDFAGVSYKLDVDDPDLRVYLHEDRLNLGSKKAFQHPTHDVFSLGMVMIEIGLWRRFKVLEKYQKADTDKERRAFAMRLRKLFRDETQGENMGIQYGRAISHCVGLATAPDSDKGVSADSPFGSPSAAHVIEILMKC